jgi:hypothetical protein
MLIEPVGHVEQHDGRKALQIGNTASLTLKNTEEPAATPAMTVAVRHGSCNRKILGVNNMVWRKRKLQDGRPADSSA